MKLEYNRKEESFLRVAYFCYFSVSKYIIHLQDQTQITGTKLHGFGIQLGNRIGISRREYVTNPVSVIYHSQYSEPPLSNNFVHLWVLISHRYSFPIKFFEKHKKGV